MTCKSNIVYFCSSMLFSSVQKNVCGNVGGLPYISCTQTQNGNKSRYLLLQQNVRINM